MKIIFAIAGLHPEYGGPSRSVTALAGSLGQGGANVELLALHNGSGWQPPVTPPEKFARTTFVDASSALAQKLRWTPRFQKVLRERCLANHSQLIHDTGVWLPTNHVAASVARELQLPLLVSPRGMLMGWALEYRAWKKKLAWKLFQQRALESARLLHATSAAEAKDFRALGLRQPIAVIPNGVELPPAPTPNSQLPTPNSRTVLFMGRVHPKKGLADLVAAWAAARPHGWRVVIAGGDELNHRAELEREIRARGLTQEFSFTGLVSAEQRWEIYRAADVFVLPSHSENFGLVVAEALACGVPVIATQGTPWADLAARRCGWWIPNGVTALAAALRAACAQTDDERRAMGERGRVLVTEKFAWAGVAAQMRDVYAWVLGLAPKPACVID
ncbi:MAG: hypothetical protein RLZZ350_1704 [Verrucomicrobiota bacterium]|jgi:glycosyltransferase involved in cell wall biosynthesis